jgi:hypothetical protein
MFYFKDSPPASLSEIDPEQLKQILAFREHVKSRGLIRTFKTRDEFAKLLRIHLSDEVQAWVKRRNTSRSDPSEIATSSEPLTTIKAESETVITTAANEAQEEEGYLDLIERGEDAFKALAETMHGLRRYSRRLEHARPKKLRR